MRVKVNSIWYDSEEDTIAVELTPSDRLYIAAMPPDASKFGQAPEGRFATPDEFLAWMRDENDDEAEVVDDGDE